MSKCKKCYFFREGRQRFCCILRYERKAAFVACLAKIQWLAVKIVHPWCRWGRLWECIAQFGRNICWVLPAGWRATHRLLHWWLLLSIWRSAHRHCSIFVSVVLRSVSCWWHLCVIRVRKRFISVVSWRGWRYRWGPFPPSFVVWTGWRRESSWGSPFPLEISANRTGSWGTCVLCDRGRV